MPCVGPDLGPDSLQRLPADDKSCLFHNQYVQCSPEVYILYCYLQINRKVYHMLLFLNETLQLGVEKKELLGMGKYESIMSVRVG